VSQKGVSSTVVIVIVIIIAVVGIGGYLLLKGGEGGLRGLPVYPGSEYYDIPEEHFGEFLLEGVEIEGYTVSASVQDMMDWYSDHMTEWTIEDESTQPQMEMTIGMQLYRKGIEGAVVVAMSGTGVVDDTIFILLTGLWSELGGYGGLGEEGGATIYINGNAGFTAANGVVAGDGTVGDPYIIENWDISAENAHGIWINNTTAYFVIRNSVVENGWWTYYGIYLDNVMNGRIENCISQNNSLGINLEHSSNNTISNNTSSSNRWSGIPLSDSDNNILDNNTLSSNGEYDIYLKGSSNNTLTNNTCENSYYGINISHSDNLIISNNTSENAGWYGIVIIYSSNNTLTNNTYSSNRYNFGVWGSDISHFDHDIDSSNLVEGRPIYYLRGHEDEVIGPFMNVGYLALVRCDNIRVENLTIENNEQGILLASTQNSQVINSTFRSNVFGISLYFSDNNTLNNNTSSGNDDYGIRLYLSDNNTLNNNTSSGNDDYGIRLRFSDNNTLDTNTCENNQYGIHLYNSSNNIIKNNTCENNDWYGIRLEGSSNNTLTNNTCENNGWDGTSLYRSSNNTISNNNLKNNGTGIYVYSNSNHNLVYQNNLINNERQAYDTSGTNTWDNGYPSGGNYWSDYTGVDENRGENQDIPGPDGIGDTPYGILGDNNQDRYPMMNLVD